MIAFLLEAGAVLLGAGGVLGHALITDLHARGIRVLDRK